MVATILSAWHDEQCDKVGVYSPRLFRIVRRDLEIRMNGMLDRYGVANGSSH